MLDLNLRDGTWIVDTKLMFEEIVDDLQKGVGAAQISRRFHNGLILVFQQIAERVREASDINRVCLSGGSFHNVILTSWVAKEPRGERL